MSKVVDQLTPEDFGKSFDAATFSEWKKSVDAHEKAGMINIVLFVVGLAAMIALGGIVGIALFFIFAITGIVLSMPKQKKRKEYQQQLGISNSDYKEAIATCRNRMK